MKKTITFSVLVFLLNTTCLFGQTTEQPSGKLSGVFFIDYYYNMMRDTAIGSMPNTILKGAEDVHGFQVRRIYLTYDYRFNSKFSSKFRLESDEANFTSNLTGNKPNKFGMFVKDAYVKWNYFGKHDVYFGIQGTPGFEISERIWGNRYIEKTIMDVRGICPSRDLGVSFRGNIDSAGVFKYWFMFANGNAGLPETDKYKRYYGNLEITPIKNFTITLFADYQSKKPFANDFISSEKLNNNILTGALFLGYRKKDKFSCGIETFYRKTENAYKLTDKYVDADGFGYSLFTTYHISQKINAFARFDKLEPNIHKLSDGDMRDLYIVGVAYKPSVNFTLSPNVFVETYEKKGVKKFKSSITPRLTINWSF